MHNSDSTILVKMLGIFCTYIIVYNDCLNNLSNIYNRIDNHIQRISSWMIFV